MTTTRRADSSDLPVLRRLAVRTYCDAFGGDFAPTDLDAHLRNNLSTACFATILATDIVLVAECELDMVGYVQFGHARIEQATNVNDKEIYRLYVLSSFQNKGIGTLLLNSALDWYVNQNVERVYLDVWENNENAIRFYRRHGFEIVGKRAFTVESGAQTGFDLIMARTVSRD